MIHVYLAHPLSAPTREGIDQNRANAAKWAAWLWRQGFAVQCSWIVCTGELEETPENRELGLASDCEQVSRCDVMALCGPRISSGMMREARSAKLIVDFTDRGFELPPDWLRWKDGRPLLLADVEYRMRYPDEVLASGMVAPSTVDRSTVLTGHRPDCAHAKSDPIAMCTCGAMGGVCHRCGNPLNGHDDRQCLANVGRLDRSAP